MFQSLLILSVLMPIHLFEWCRFSLKLILLIFFQGDQMEIIDDTDPDWWVARHLLTGKIDRRYIDSRL